MTTAWPVANPLPAGALTTTPLTLVDELLAAAGVVETRRRPLATLTVASLRGLLLDLLVSRDADRTGRALDELAEVIAAAATASAST